MNFLYLLMGLAPSLIWLNFFLQEDLHPEPRKMIFATFIAGVFAAVAAYIAQQVVGGYFATVNIGQHDLWFVAAYAGIEEFLKFLAAYLVVRNSKYFDEPVDAMIYMMTAAMGLAAVENIGVAFDQAGLGGKVGSLMFRFLGATLLHALSSSLLGYYWAKGIIKRHHDLFIIWGLVVATLLHTLFNYIIIVVDNGGILYSIGLLILSAFFIFYDFEEAKKMPVFSR